jgi:hypothetical protein
MYQQILNRLVAVMMLCGGRVFAQATPRVTVDLSYGGGGHSESAGATWYRRDSNVDPRVAVAATSSPWQFITAFLSAEYVGQWGASDFISDCVPAPNGTCRQYFPRLQGRGITAGVRAHARRLAFGLGIGRVGGFKWTAADVDAELGLGAHVGCVVAARAASRNGPDAHPIDYWPVNVGIRFTF